MTMMLSSYIFGSPRFGLLHWLAVIVLECGMKGLCNSKREWVLRFLLILWVSASYLLFFFAANSIYNQWRSCRPRKYGFYQELDCDWSVPSTARASSASSVVLMERNIVYILAKDLKDRIFNGSWGSGPKTGALVKEAIVMWKLYENVKFQPRLLEWQFH